MKSPAYAGRVHRVMNYVRENLDSDLRLETLARVACFSPYHFHRMFKATTGETLTAFVQRARLERAAYLMMASPSRKLDSIALEVGFSAHSDFTRVFKKHFGIAPSVWDRRTRLDAQPIVEDFDLMVTRAHEQNGPPKLRVVEQPPRRLVYVRTNTPFLGKPLREGYERLTRFLDARGLDWRRQQLLGWSWDNHETTPISQVHFDFGFVVPEGFEPDTDDIGLQSFAAHRAVQARVTGPLLDIAVAWHVLYDEWLPASSWEPADLPGIKIFRRRPDELGWDTFDLWCSLALRPLQP